MLHTRRYLIRPPSLACTWRKEMSWLSVAAYSFTGTLTSPKDTAPFQIARMGGSVPVYDVPNRLSPYPSWPTGIAKRQVTSPAASALRQDGRHAPDVRHEGDCRTARRRVAARGQVGRHPGPRRGRGRHRPDALAQRERRDRGLPRAAGPRRPRAGPPARRGDRRAGRRDPALLRDRRPDARPEHPARRAACEDQPGDADRVRPAPARRSGPHGTAAHRETCPARLARRRRPALAGPGDVRRRRHALRRHRAAGPRGDRQQEARLPVLPRPAFGGLAEVPAPPDAVLRRRRLAPGDRQRVTAPGGAGGAADRPGA